MSRDRYERDEDTRSYYRGGPRGRDDYGRDSYSRGREYGYDDYGDRPRRAYGDRGYYRDDYSREALDEGRDYRDNRDAGYDAEPRRGSRRSAEYDDPEGRSLFEEGRDYIQRKLGWDDSRHEDQSRDRNRRSRGATRSHVRCRDIMTRDVTVARRDTPLQEVAAMMRDEDTGVIPVVEQPGNTAASTPATAATASSETIDDGRRVNDRLVGMGRLVGLITDRDIVVRALAEGKDARTTRVEEVMTTDIHSARPNDRVIDAIRKMGDKQVRRIPVVDDRGTLRGIISMADVALETEDDRELADALEEISSGQSFWSRVFG